MYIFAVLVGVFGTTLGASAALLGVFGALLGAFAALLGVFGILLDIFEALLSVFGALLGIFGALLGVFEALLEGFAGHEMVLYTPLGAVWIVISNYVNHVTSLCSPPERCHLYLYRSRASQ